MNFKKLVKLPGDASHRKFFRDKKNQFIVVYSKKEKKKNLLIYSAINNLLRSYKIYTPKLIRENYKENYIIIEDLGNLTGRKKFKKFRFINYLKLFKLLDKLKSIKKKKISTFNKKYIIPNYTKNELLKEAKMFSEWYILKNKFRSGNKISKFYIQIVKKLISGLKLKKRIFVHRDFHISNIMIKEDNLYLIDTQDAVYGNQAYDLASLIDDVRIKVSFKKREMLFNKYVCTQKKVNALNLRHDFEVLSILRNFKIIGIFTRLSKRDKKHQYLKMIPYAWKMIDQRRKNKQHLKDLNSFIDLYFPKKKR